MDYTNSLTSIDVNLYTDAAKHPKLGFGGMCMQDYMYSQWEPGFIESKNPSIQYLELYAVVTAAYLWLKRLANKHIIFYCDNRSVCDMITDNSSKCKNCMVLIRILVLQQLIHNVHIEMVHVESKSNFLADSLSRLKLDQFWEDIQELDIKMNEKKTPLPNVLWPTSKLWIN